MRHIFVIAAFAVVVSLGSLAVPSIGAQTTGEQIARALSAGPASITTGATIINSDAKGKMTQLRKGTNGWTCYAGHPGVMEDDPFCADRQAMIFAADWMAHKAKPTNTKPGIIYMLAGGHDWSADDPWATKGTPISEPPHWMIMWPYDPKTSGLSSKVSDTGTWIMWANTPYAHLMINQKP